MVLIPGQALDPNFRGKPRGIKPYFSSAVRVSQSACRRIRQPAEEAQAERESGLKTMTLMIRFIGNPGYPGLHIKDSY